MQGETLFSLFFLNCYHQQEENTSLEQDLELRVPTTLPEQPSDKPSLAAQPRVEMNILPGTSWDGVGWDEGSSLPSSLQSAVGMHVNENISWLLQLRAQSSF